MAVGLAYLQYANEEVMFTVNIPWLWVDEFDPDEHDRVMKYMLDNFGLDPMLCVDTYFEEA